VQRLHAEVQRLRAEGQRSESLSSELEKLQLLPRPGPPPGLPRWRFGPDTVWDRPVRKHCSEIALGTLEFGAGIVTFERDEIRWTFSMPESHSSHCFPWPSWTLKLRTASLCSASVSDIDFDLSLRGFVDVPLDLRGYDLSWELCRFAPRTSPTTSIGTSIADHYDPFSQPGSAKSYIRLRFDSSNDRLEALEAVPRIREILRLTIMTDDCGGYYWGPFHPRAQDEPWMAAERERRGRRDERYDPAAVARLWEEGERAREEAGEASAAAASQPAASPRQGAEPERQALSAFFDYPAAQALAGCQASWNPAGV